MTANKVRADYEELAQIAVTFDCQAEKIHWTLNQLHKDLDLLLEGDWAGRGATEFYREMISDVLPSVKRLGDALERAARDTRQMSRIMKQAEDDSARLFTIDWVERYRGAGQGDPDFPGPVDDWLRDFFQRMAEALGLQWNGDNAGTRALPDPAVTITTPTPGAATAAPAGTPPPASTPPPTAVPTQGSAGTTMYVNNPANLRSDPSLPTDPLKNNIVGQLSLGQAVQVIGGPTGMIDNHIWYQVNANGQTGWVAGDLLSGEVPSGGGVPVVSSLTDAAQAIAPLSNASSSGGNLYGEMEYFGDGSPKGLHPGIDISSSDTTVKANANGTVYFYQTWKDAEDKWHTDRYYEDTARSNSEFDEDDGFANYIVLETEIDNTKYYQVFAHLDSFDSDLTQGQQVTAGTVLGTMGCTGSCAGAHVHWEIRRDNAVVPDSNHSFGSIWYPKDDTELKLYFVNPEDFAAMLNPNP